MYLILGGACVFSIAHKKKYCLAMARWLGWLEHHPIHQKVAGSIPGQGTYLGCGFDLRSGRVWEATDRCFSITSTFLSLCLSLSFSLPLSLKSISMSSDEKFLKFA